MCLNVKECLCNLYQMEIDGADLSLCAVFRGFCHTAHFDTFIAFYALAGGNDLYSFHKHSRDCWSLQ